jgi:hypothetical protein
MDHGGARDPQRVADFVENRLDGEHDGVTQGGRRGHGQRNQPDT